MDQKRAQREPPRELAMGPCQPKDLLLYENFSSINDGDKNMTILKVFRQQNENMPIFAVKHVKSSHTNPGFVNHLQTGIKKKCPHMH